MAYIDYEFYTGTFGGSDVPQEDFPRLAQMASDIMDAIVYRPISEVTERVKRAVCYEMDMLFVQGGADAANGQSSSEISYEMLGDYSVTAQTASSSSSSASMSLNGIPISKLAESLLRAEGLMSRWAYAGTRIDRG